MKQRKLVIVSALVGAVVAAGVVVPTMAWLSDGSEKVVNKFQSENITITLDEAVVEATTGKAIDAVNSRTSAEQNYKVVAGRVVDKDPTPTVEKGSVPAVVYVKVTNGDKDNFTPAYDTADWTKVSGDASKAIYRYNAVVDAYNAAEDVTLKPIFETVKVSDKLEHYNGEIQITALAYAVQAEGLVTEADGTVDYTAADKQAKAYFNSENN